MTKKPPQKIVVAVKRQSPVATDKLKIKSPWKALTPPKKAKLSETGWIGAIDALQLLTPHFGDEESAKAEIVQRLSQGSLTCRAACWCQEADRGKVDWHDIDWGGYKTSTPHDGQKELTIFEQPAGDDRRISVPMDIFLGSTGWTIDPEEADWKWGYFIARKPAELLPKPTRFSAKTPMLRRFTTGLEFHLSEVGGLTTGKSETSDPDGLVSGGAPGNQRSNRGRRRDPKWGPWHAEILVYACQEGIDTDMTAQEFYDAIALRMVSRKLDCPDSASAAKEISALFSRWKEAKHNEEIEDLSSKAI